jgi:hypothetical protein
MFSTYLIKLNTCLTLQNTYMHYLYLGKEVVFENRRLKIIELHTMAIDCIIELHTS